MSQRTLEEQETIIRWDRTPADAMLYTASPNEAARWRKLGVSVMPLGAYGWQATVPKKAVRIRRLIEGALPVPKASPGRFQKANPTVKTTGNAALSQGESE